MRRSAWFRTNLILTAALIGMAAPGTAGGTNVPCPTAKAEERHMATLANQERVGRDRPQLILDAELSRVARTHTADMIERNELEHTPPAQLARWTTRWVELTENIGKGHDTPGLFETFMNSAPHRRRILSTRYNHVGVGILFDDNGQMWVTMVFESTRDPGTSLPRPVCPNGN